MVVPLSGAGHQRVTHPFATLTFRRIQKIPFDLHALGTPLAFILSQDQTLRREFYAPYTRNYFFWINCFAQSSCLLFLSLFNCQCSRSSRLFYRQKILNSLLRFENLCFYIFQCFALIWAATLFAQQDNYYSVSLFSVKIKIKIDFESLLTFSMFHSYFGDYIVAQQEGNSNHSFPSVKANL